MTKANESKTEVREAHDEGNKFSSISIDINTGEPDKEVIIISEQLIVRSETTEREKLKKETIPR